MTVDFTMGRDRSQTATNQSRPCQRRVANGPKRLRPIVAISNDGLRPWTPPIIRCTCVVFDGENLEMLEKTMREKKNKKEGMRIAKKCPYFQKVAAQDSHRPIQKFTV